MATDVQALAAGFTLPEDTDWAAAGAAAIRQNALAAVDLAVAHSKSIELVSGTITLDNTGRPIREFYTTGSATINGVAFPAGTAVVWRRTPAGVWGFIVVDDWTDLAATTTTTTTSATTTTTTTTSLGALETAIMARSPLGLWKLDETSGTTAFDSSGNGRHGTYVGDVSLNYGPHNGFPAFPGLSGSYIQVPDDDALSLTTAPGLSFFALAYNTGAQATTRYVTSKGTASGNFEYGFLRTDTNQLQVSVWDPSGTPLNVRIGASALTNATWHGVAATIADAAGNGGTGIALYKDNNTPTSGSTSGTGSGYANGSGSLRIGQAWQGSLGYVAAFAGPLSAADIDVLMGAARAEGLIP